jgi:hypothetical protein
MIARRHGDPPLAYANSIAIAGRLSTGRKSEHAADIPAQHQDRQPGRTDEMQPQPSDSMQDYRPGGKLKGKRALITGGDSGIGRAVAIGMAKEGADVAILYLEEDRDAEATREWWSARA